MATWIRSLICTVSFLSLFTGYLSYDVLDGIGLVISCKTDGISVNSKSVVWYKKKECNSAEVSDPISSNMTYHFDVVSYQKDKGCYQCIDQANNLTLFNDTLNILGSPDVVWLVDESGRNISAVSGAIGETVQLICKIPYSNPAPNVQWTFGSGVIIGNGTLEPEEEFKYSNVIDFELTKELAGESIACSAQSLALIYPASAYAKVFIEPVNVTILSPTDTRYINLKRNTINNITCVAFGGFPPPKIRWKLENETLYESASDMGCNVSCSQLSFDAKIEYHDKTLSCTAWNYPGDEVTTANRIKTLGIPVFQGLQKYKQADQDDRLEISVFFLSFPPFQNVIWQKKVGSDLKTFESRLHKEGEAFVRVGSKATLIGNFSKFVIPGFRTEDTGNYMVTVTNSEGKACWEVKVVMTMESKPESNNLFIGLIVTVSTLLVMGCVCIFIMYRRLYVLQKRRSQPPEATFRCTMQSINVQHRRRLSSPRCSFVSTYEEIDNVLASNSSMSSEPKDAPVDVLDYEIPQVNRTKARKPIPDVCVYVNTQEQDSATLLSS